jgi:hypothetical protein
MVPVVSLAVSLIMAIERLRLATPQSIPSTLNPL